jgi:hypothetical protein
MKNSAAAIQHDDVNTPVSSAYMCTPLCSLLGSACRRARVYRHNDPRVSTTRIQSPPHAWTILSLLFWNHDGLDTCKCLVLLLARSETWYGTMDMIVVAAFRLFLFVWSLRYEPCIKIYCLRHNKGIGSIAQHDKNGTSISTSTTIQEETGAVAAPVAAHLLLSLSKLSSHSAKDMTP